jgi:ABC-type lipoprotein export system ATPase subunit
MITLSARGVNSRARRLHGTPVLHDVNLDVHARCLTAVVGPSGAGKSTLLDILTGVVAPATGTVHLGPHTVHPAGRRRRAQIRARIISTARQSGDLIDALSVDENAELGQRLAGVRDRAAIEEVMEALAIGADMRRTAVADLSGGERQRVALARTLASGTPAMACDEPTSALDEHASARVHASLRAAADRGRLVLVASHDPSLVVLADRIVWVSRGVVAGVLDAPTEEEVHRLMQASS